MIIGVVNNSIVSVGQISLSPKKEDFIIVKLQYRLKKITGGKGLEVQLWRN